MSAPGPDNDLNEKLDAYVQRAMADELAMVYAFGEPWGAETDKADDYFGFLPGNGIHDIHMNQGNPRGRFFRDNGPWQDGGLIFEFPEQAQWVAVFLKFQSQAWHSEDDTGDPALPSDPDFPNDPHYPIDPNGIPPHSVPDGLVRIIAGYVNDIRSPERETVTLLNTADTPVSLRRLEDCRQAKEQDAIVRIDRSRGDARHPHRRAGRPVEQGWDHHSAGRTGNKSPRRVLYQGAGATARPNDPVPDVGAQGRRLVARRGSWRRNRDADLIRRVG